MFYNNFIPSEVKLDFPHRHFVEHDSARAKGHTTDSTTICSQVIIIGWLCPSPMVVKLNVDGASKGNPALAGCGCVLSNLEGQWLIGTDRNLGICNSQQAESWAALLGLRLAWDQGFRRVLLETDSTTVHRLLTSKDHVQLKLNPMFHECISLLGIWMIQVNNIYRKANCELGPIPRSWISFAPRSSNVH